MKIGEVIIEHVLAGFLLLAMFALPFLPEAGALLRSPGSGSILKDFMLGGAAVGIAYLFGVFADRYADTILETLEQHSRVRYALTESLKHPPRYIRRPDKDTFAEGELRMLALEKGGAIAEMTASIRTRMRITRSFAIFLPGIGAAAAVGIQRACEPAYGMPRKGWDACLSGPAAGTAAAVEAGVAIFAVYFVVLPLLNWVSKAPQSSPDFWRPPKTFDAEKLMKYAETRGATEYLKAARPDLTWPQPEAKVRFAALWRLRDVFLNPTVLVVGLGALYAICLAWRSPLERLWLVPAAMLALGVLCGWAWRRIYGTYMGNLKLFERFVLDRPPT